MAQRPTRGGVDLKRFLPTDIGITPQEANDAYRQLYERGLIELVEHSSGHERDDRISLRLIVRGQDSKHAPEYREEEFGYAGARIGGEVTLAHSKVIELPTTLPAMLARWFTDQQHLTELKDILQSKIGLDKIYVEKAELKHKENAPVLLLQFRYPLGADIDFLDSEFSRIAECWLRERLLLNELPD